MKVLTITTIPTFAHTTASILTIVNSHLDGWETKLSHKYTTHTQHQKGWKTCTTLKTAGLSKTNKDTIPNPKGIKVGIQFKGCMQ
jgi:hypothetical protein